MVVAKDTHMKVSLNGDYNPLHADPAVGEAVGYSGMIMHGVFAYNMVAHGIVKVIGGENPMSLREISAKFSGPVRPGDHLDVSLWNLGEMDVAGCKSIVWQTHVRGTERPCLTEGRALVGTYSR